MYLACPGFQKKKKTLKNGFNFPCVTAKLLWNVNTTLLEKVLKKIWSGSDLFIIIQDRFPSSISKRHFRFLHRQPFCKGKFMYEYAKRTGGEKRLYTPGISPAGESKPPTVKTRHFGWISAPYFHLLRIEVYFKGIRTLNIGNGNR